MLRKIDGVDVTFTGGSAISQVCPQSVQSFSTHARLLTELLVEQGVDLSLCCRSYRFLNPYPIKLSQHECSTQRRLQRVLYRAIIGVVNGFFADKRLQELYGFPEEISTLLGSLKEIEYRPGSYRPDILYDEQGLMKICEINARFPANAYFSSQYIRNVIPELSYLSKEYRVFNYPNSQMPMLARFPENARIHIARDSEQSTDMHFLERELNLCGYDCKTIAPNELRQIPSADCAILELHQEEMLAYDNYASIRSCASRMQYFNDLRTIFLVHDKRFLAVLTRIDIMADYIGMTDAAWLQKHVVPTYAIRHSRESIIEAIRKQSNWVLKPNLWGKGEGILFGRAETQDRWRNALRLSGNSDYVLQHYIKQMKVPIMAPLEDARVFIQDMNVVGTLLCFDDEFLGPGICRAAVGDNLNRERGGALLFRVCDSASVV